MLRCGCQSLASVYCMSLYASNVVSTTLLRMIKLLTINCVNNTITSDWSSPRSEAKAFGWLQNAVTKTHVMLQLFFIVKCFLCTTCVFEVQASSSSLGNLCTKFCFFHDFHCWLSAWRKITFSITHSLTQHILCAGNWSVRFGKNLM